jgi:hypothetical protein
MACKLHPRVCCADHIESSDLPDVCQHQAFSRDASLHNLQRGERRNGWLPAASNSWRTDSPRVPRTAGARPSDQGTRFLRSSDGTDSQPPLLPTVVRQRRPRQTKARRLKTEQTRGGTQNAILGSHLASRISAKERTSHETHPCIDLVVLRSDRIPSSRSPVR